MRMLNSIWRSQWRHSGTIHSDICHSFTRHSFHPFIKWRFLDGCTSVNTHNNIIQTLVERIVDGKFWRFLRHVFLMGCCSVSLCIATGVSIYIEELMYRYIAMSLLKHRLLWRWIIIMYQRMIEYFYFDVRFNYKLSITI